MRPWAFVTGGSVHHGDTPLTHGDPDCRPLVVPLPSLGHRKFCVACLARGHPGSGEAAIMGVPVPHIVLPFPPLDSSSVCCVLAIWWTAPNVFALLWLHSCLVSPIALLCGHAVRRRAHSTMALALCVVCASRRGVGVDRRRACPRRRDVGPLAHSRCQWWCDPLGNNGPCEVVCVNRGRRTHIGYPRWSGRVGRMRVRSFDTPWWVCAVAVVGHCDWRFGTPWRHPIDT